jgi:hypothetical protein
VQSETRTLEIGNDAGGEIALEERRELIDRLVLFGTGPNDVDIGDSSAAAADIENALPIHKLSDAIHAGLSRDGRRDGAPNARQDGRQFVKEIGAKSRAEIGADVGAEIGAAIRGKRGAEIGATIGAT